MHTAQRAMLNDTQPTVESAIAADTHGDQQRRQNIERLVTRAKELGLQPKDLDGLVHDAFSAPASEINNGGLEQQIAFLVDKHGAADADRMIGEAGAEH